FIDADAIEAQTGYAIRSAWRKPGDDRPLPDADGIVVTPATFNTINKWAAGIADTLALGILFEAYGKGVPTAVQPRVSAELALHPAFEQSLDRLKSMGVRIAQTSTGSYSWTRALDLLND
ncbi:flavoprotein, partial [Streptomyces sp. FH025]|uniref:flavoprotein n=1 Tax=Streptomyces sp. FH025 TaxID=2815937 RepID=UPI001ACB445F